MTATNSVMSLLFSSEERPLGRSWEHWTTRWWQWFLSIPTGDSPVTNNTDNNSCIGSSDPNVFFLASTIGGRVERTVKIPSGKAVLFPVINVTISNSEEPALDTDPKMISFVKHLMDDIVEKQANIDGEELLISDTFRVQSPPFNFSYPPDNIFGARGGPTRGVGDGYWIFMRPMQPGRHAIKTYGACMSGKIQIGAEIELIVENNSS